MNVQELVPARDRRVILILLGLALALRLVAVVLFDNRAADSDDYAANASRLLSGLPLAHRNAQEFVRPPGYSILIAVIWFLSGTRSLLLVEIVQAVIGTGTCWFIYRNATLLNAHRLVPVVALAIAAFYPYLIQQSVAVLTEGPFAFFVASGVYYLARGLLANPFETKALILAGCLLGCGNMIRPNLTPLVPLLGVWLIWRWWRRPRDLAKLAVCLAFPVLLVGLPWTYSAWRHGLGVMWVTDGGGALYRVGHFDGALKITGCVPTTDEELRELGNSRMFTRSPTHDRARRLPMDRRQEPFWQDSFEWDRQHVADLPCLTAKKVFMHWKPWVGPGQFSKLQILLSASALPVLLLGLVGLYLARRAGERVMSELTIICAIGGTIVAAIFTSQARYRVPINDLTLVPFTAFAAVHAFKLWTLRARGLRSNGVRAGNTSS